ncbi:ABC transporter permease [Actinomyces ruminicola]|uniref:ABC-2 type transport system permease protein n=1 Tax=Actinomyces ruminicola TaxID=332524 RepID=A0A1G9TV37_9ACTO|nr:ABC transporter permease [Actinomyces ruminicola]SDM51533.1 ABC-2 type transport system permease protein [Actinomyces ruminicola]
MSASYNTSRWEEIRLVAGRELRTQLFKRSAVISTLIMLVLAVGGVLVVARLTGGEDQPYRLGVSASQASTVSALTPALEQVTGSNGLPIEVTDVSDTEAEAVLGISGDRDEEAEEATVDMVLDLTAPSPALKVTELDKADQAVVASVTNVLQQVALSEQITALGGDPAQVATSLTDAVPQVEALDPPDRDGEDFGVRYTVLMIIDVLLFIVVMGGGQTIAMGVVEEKSSRIVEILLACVRPTSLLAGKILGTGTAILVSYGVIGVAAGMTAKLSGVLPEGSVDIDAVLIAMLVWMVVGYATYAVGFAAAGSLVSRQEDVSTVVMPLTMTLMIPYILSFVMAMQDPSALVYRVLAYLPPFAPFLMPVRLVLGVSSWGEQLVTLGIALAFIPVFVWLAATVYTRAVTRTGARVPLKEVLARRPA